MSLGVCNKISCCVSRNSNMGRHIFQQESGAFFPATVTRASGGTYDVAFFDGDRETGLDRSMIKLISPPADAAAATARVPTMWTPPK